MSEISISIATIPLLVIDADRTFHAVVQAAGASMPGVQVICCTSPGEALNRMGGFTPALIVIDGRLGGAASLNFVRRVRAGQTPAPAGTLVMFVAQDFSGGLSGKLVDVGCHAITRKPLSPDALARAIMRVFENPAPQVMGGKYLGPDRRKAGATGKHDPERRRMPVRGGWGATPRMSSGSISLVSMTTSETPQTPVAKASPAVETAPPRPAGGKIDLTDAPPPKPKSTPLEAAADVRPARTRSEAIEAPPAAPAPRVREAYDLAPPPAEQSESNKEPQFDVGAVVEQHRQWIASNGTAGARANLAGRPLSGAALSGQNLAKANLRGADLTNADLRQCVLIDADLRDASLAQALLDEAQLAGAKIRHADLQFAQLSQSGLQGSDLAGADLRGAVLAGADLAGANLLGTDLRGTDLTGINLTQKQLDRANGDRTTKLPPGLFVSRGEAVEE